MKSLLGFKARAQTAVSVCGVVWATNEFAHFDTEVYVATWCWQDLTAWEFDLAFDRRCRSSSIGSLHRAAETNPALGCSRPRSSPKTCMKVEPQDQFFEALFATIMQAFLPFPVCTGGLEARAASSDSGKHVHLTQRTSNQGAVPSSMSAMAGFHSTALLLQQLLQEIQLLRDKQHLRQRRKGQLILSSNCYSRMRAARPYGKNSCQCH